MDNYNRVVEGLRAALIDERTTAAFYAIMRDQSESYPGVEAFAEARKDELDHARTITELLVELTGRQPEEATVPVRPPNIINYCEGLRHALRGETNAQAEYRNIVQISPFPSVNAALEEIILDEEVHFHKFSKLYELICRNTYFSATDENHDS